MSASVSLSTSHQSLAAMYVPSPRGAQSMLLGAKIKALLDGRFSASCDDIRGVAPGALRHRLILSFEGEAEGISTDDIIEEILDLVPEHQE